MSREAFGLLRKVHEVDEVLRKHLNQRRKVVEVHPELSFRMWQGRPMRYPKRKKAGKAERGRLIRGCWPEAVVRCETSFARTECGLDDLYDAFAALWSARREALGVAEQSPEIAPRDAHGLPMRIIA